MKIHNLLFVIICFSLISCIKKYKRTIAVCNGKFFIEVYNVNPAGVDADYLTDSTNFKLYLGKYDNEHENIHCSCSGDTLFVEKLAPDEDGEQRITETKIYSLKDLKKKKAFE